MVPGRCAPAPGAGATRGLLDDAGAVLGRQAGRGQREIQEISVAYAAADEP
jgi:hypothetical protein